jgi:hypothetical protein
MDKIMVMAGLITVQSWSRSGNYFQWVHNTDSSSELAMGHTFFFIAPIASVRLKRF